MTDRPILLILAMIAAAFMGASVAIPAEGDATPPSVPFFTVLWGGGTRIPSIDVTTDGTLLAFAQRGGGDNHPNHVEMRRSTDGGRTWAKAVDFLKDWEGKVSCANPSSIVDRKSGTIWAFWAVRQGGIHKGVHYCHSTDDGVTWSDLAVLSVDGRPAIGLPTTSRGIQLSSGRLLLPYTVLADPSGRGGGYAHIRTIYSDDHGKTWQYGNPAKWQHVTSSECTVLELADGRVYMNRRDLNHRGGYRLAAFSEDGGVTWSQPVRSALAQPANGCHSGLIRLTHPETDGKSRILYSSPWFGPDGKFVPKDMGRQNLTIQISYDECKTWRPLKRLWEGSSVYSNLIVLPDKSIGCVFESNKPGWQTIHFARFTLDWLTDGQDKVAVE
jgi:sialidase-1